MLPGLFVSARANAHTHAHTWIYSTRLKRIDYTVFDTRFFLKLGVTQPGIYHRFVNCELQHLSPARNLRARQGVWSCV